MGSGVHGYSGIITTVGVSHKEWPDCSVLLNFKHLIKNGLAAVRVVLFQQSFSGSSSLRMNPLLKNNSCDICSSLEYPICNLGEICTLKPVALICLSVCT